MPELSRFFGIVITMFFDDHNPPHFHARYGDAEASISIPTLSVIRGYLPARALGLVMEWAALHRIELMQEWQNAIDLNPIGHIAPLV